MERWSEHRTAGAVLAAVLITWGCGPGRPVDSAEALADALKAHGLRFDALEGIDLTSMQYAKIEEGVGLRGERLAVDILRIEDDRTFELAQEAWLLRAHQQAGASPGTAGQPVVFLAKPYVIVIRDEPESGYVLNAVRKVFPERLG